MKTKKELRSAYLSLRLTPEDRRRLDKEAAKLDLDPSTYARVLIIQGLEKVKNDHKPPQPLMA